MDWETAQKIPWNIVLLFGGGFALALGFQSSGLAIWFGEQLPAGAMDRATEAARECDVCFSIGTSTLVQPAASLPFIALNAGAVVIEINPVPTSLSRSASFSLQATAADALTSITAELTDGK